jgi:BlaI family transcriptional regulator, penicillinase repressor
MEREQDNVTEAELAVLQALWERQPATIRQITDAVYNDAGDAKYATVQKLLERLEEKGHVERDRRQHAHQFTARTSRDALVGRRLRAMAEELTGGMMAPLLSHLLRAEALTAGERRELRDLIDELERKKSSQPKR